MRHAPAAAAICTMVWVVIRAAHQAITIDEATTFLSLVHHAETFQWNPDANNHLLNTLLMRLSTTLFRVSPLTVRLPALLGAALYISAAYRFCRAIAASPAMQLLAFLCLAANPFIMDYLVAARGYGMALGFLLWALLVGYTAVSPASLALAATLLALAFTANFSFAFAVAAAFLAILYRHRASLSPPLWAAALIPPAAVILLLPASMLLHWPSGELWYGATSLTETVATIADATLYRINPHLANPTVVRLFINLKPVVLPLAAATALIYAAYLLRTRSQHANLKLAGFLAAIAAAALVLHLMAHYAFGLLLPKDRTGLFFVPLIAAAAAAIAAIPPPNARARYLRSSTIAAQTLLAVYFLFCLRLDYFKEWNWDSETDQLYGVLSCLHRQDHVDRVAAAWPFIDALNFYRAADTGLTFAAVADQNANPPGIQAYALDPFLVPGVAASKNLTVIYRAPSTNARIAVPAEQAALAQSVCLELPQYGSVR